MINEKNIIVSLCLKLTVRYKHVRNFQILNYHLLSTLQIKTVETLRPSCLFLGKNLFQGYPRPCLILFFCQMPCMWNKQPFCALLIVTLLSRAGFTSNTSSFPFKCHEVTVRASLTWNTLLVSLTQPLHHCLYKSTCTVSLLQHIRAS